MLYLTLIIPVIAIAVLAVIGHRAYGAHVNLLCTAAMLACSINMALQVLQSGALTSPGGQFYVDAFNVYLLVLTTFIGFTTAIFSRPYMEHEQQIGRVTRNRLRLYHASFQGFLFTMLLALSTNNLGILWVSMEGATLSSVLLVSLYPHTRGHRGSLEIFYSLRRRHRTGSIRYRTTIFRRLQHGPQRRRCALVEQTH